MLGTGKWKDVLHKA